LIRGTNEEMGMMMGVVVSDLFSLRTSV